MAGFYLYGATIPQLEAGEHQTIEPVLAENQVPASYLANIGNRYNTLTQAILEVTLSELQKLDGLSRIIVDKNGEGMSIALLVDDLMRMLPSLTAENPANAHYRGKVDEITSSVRGLMPRMRFNIYFESEYEPEEPSAQSEAHLEEQFERLFSYH